LATPEQVRSPRPARVKEITRLLHVSALGEEEGVLDINAEVAD
jgi:hypothetical protein